MHEPKHHEDLTRFPRTFPPRALTARGWSRSRSPPHGRCTVMTATKPCRIMC